MGDPGSDLWLCRWLRWFGMGACVSLCQLCLGKLHQARSGLGKLGLGEAIEVDVDTKLGMNLMHPI